MLTLYGIPNCNTVKKARTWLDEHAIDYTFHDYKKQGIDEAKLRQWLTQEPWEKLVNRAGTTYRKLTDAEKAAVTNADAAVKLMLEKPSVIKRPVVEKDGKIAAVGFDEDAYNTIFE